MGKSRLFLTVNGLLLALAVTACAAAGLAARRQDPGTAARRELVRALRLTDLAVWTEARYTRHPSQADRFAPFQDHPSSLEHFPAGSVVVAPEITTSDTTAFEE